MNQQKDEMILCRKHFFLCFFFTDKKYVYTTKTEPPLLIQQIKVEGSQFKPH